MVWDIFNNFFNWLTGKRKDVVVEVTGYLTCECGNKMEFKLADKGQIKCDICMNKYVLEIRLL